MGLGGHRPERVGERIQDELARLLREEVRDPRIGFVTLTGVEVSRDLRHAKIFFSVLGDDFEETRRALVRATPFLRRELSRRAGLKHTPDLLFQEDRSIRHAQRIEALLDEVPLTPTAEAPQDEDEDA